MSKHTRKLGRIGAYSYFVTIPKEIIGKYGWRENQKLTVVDKGRGLVEIRDWKRK